MSKEITELQSTITVSANTRDRIIRLTIPETSTSFKKLINISCFYNADIGYENGIFYAKTYSNDAHNQLFEDYYNLLTESD